MLGGGRPSPKGRSSYAIHSRKFKANGEMFCRDDPGSDFFEKFSLGEAMIVIVSCAGPKL
jgi:hypothetical protein